MSTVSNPDQLRRPHAFWWRWLVVVDAGVLLCGLGMILAPPLVRKLFGWMLLASPDAIATFGRPAVAYITLLHSVLGAVLVGWGTALLFVLYGPFRRGDREGWWALAVSVAAWFVPDTLCSLWSGFWQNALLNSVIALLFAAPLAATYRGRHEEAPGCRAVGPPSARTSRRARRAVK